MGFDTTQLLEVMKQLSTAYSDKSGAYFAMIDKHMQAAMRAAASDPAGRSELLKALGKMKRQNLVNDEQHGRFVAQLGEVMMSVAIEGPAAAAAAEVGGSRDWR